MAVAFGSFSIREYASKMRGVDVEKSWPFVRAGEQLTKEEIDGLLPSITCRKYRWWHDELEVATGGLEKPEADCTGTAVLENTSGLGTENVGIIEEEEAGAGLGAEEDPAVKICPVCGTFTASTINAVNAHIDSCLAQASREERRKAKSRAPKKRSIVEIFAVAPQIERVDDDDDEDDENEEEEEEEGSLEGDAEDADVSKLTVEEENLKANKRKRKTKKKKDSVEMIPKKKKKKKKKNKKKMKMKKRLLKPKKKMINKKKHPSGILAFSKRLAAKKEKISKLKMPSPIDYSQLLQGSLQGMRSEKEIVNPVGTQKKKLSKIKGLTKKNQLKIKTSKFNVTMQGEHHIFPIHSILKNQTAVASVQLTSAACNSLDGNLKKHQRIQHSEKRVRFSGKDDILGQRKKPCSSIELPQVQSLRKNFPDVMVDPLMKDQSEASGSFSHDSVEAPEVNRSEKDDALSIVNESEDRYSHERRQFADIEGHLFPSSVIGYDDRGCHDMEKTSLGESVDLNQALQQYDSMHLFNLGSPISHNLSCIPKVIGSMPNKGVNCHMGIHSEGNIQRALNTDCNFPESIAFPDARPAMISSLTNTTRNATSQPFLPCFATSMEPIEKQPYPLQAIRPQDSNGCSLQYRPLSCFCPKDLISSMCSTSSELTKQLAMKSVQFGEPRAISDPVSVRRDKSIDDGFIGLPLNSQGELVQLHSSGKPGFDQLFKKQNMAMASVDSFQVHNVLGPKSAMDHSHMKEKFHGESAFPNLKWFPERNYLTEAEFPPSTLGFTEMKGLGRKEAQHPNRTRERMQSVSHFGGDSFREAPLTLGLEMNLMSISSCGFGEYNQSHRHSQREKTQALGILENGFQPIAQPTMRLMGKNVTVGVSNKEGQGPDDGKIWTDKEIIAEHRYTSTVSSIPTVRKGLQPEWVVHTVSGTSKESETCSVEAPSIFQVRAVDPGPAHIDLDRQTHLMSINGLSLIDGDNVANFHPFSQQIPSQALLHKSSKIPESCISGTESFKKSHQIPVSHPHNSHLHPMLLSSAQCKGNQSLGYSAALPFLNQDRRGYIPQSCTQRPSPSFPPWLQNPRQLKEFPYPSLSHPSASIAQHHPATMSGTNLLQCASFLPSISFPSRNSNAYPCLQNPSTPASLTCNSFTPALPGFRPASAIDTSFRNRSKNRDRTNAKSTCSKDLDVAKKVRKRPASKIDESRKPTKKLTIEIQEETNASTGPQKGEYLHGYTRYNTGTPALHAHREQPVMEIEKDGFRTASGVNSLKLDAVARSGPIKLSAGAKHILKPSQNVDQDNSRPTYSTIPFAVVADSGNITDFQRKTAKIYRF